MCSARSFSEPSNRSSSPASGLVEPAIGLVKGTSGTGHQVSGEQRRALRLLFQGGDSLPLVGLTCRMIHFEDIYRASRSVGERVEAGAEDHVLAGLADQLLGQPGPDRHLGSGAGEHEVVAVQPVVGDQLVGPVAQQPLGQGVGEDVRLVVDDEVGGPGGGRGQCAGTGLVLHAAEATSVLRKSYHTGRN